MATKSPDAEAAAPPPKSKKMLLIIVLVLLVLGLIAAGGWIYLVNKRNAALLEEDGAHEEVAAVVEEPHGPPTYLPLDNMVVNLADPGGERVAQIGVTLELTGPLETESVKAYLPSIRSGILILISQRTAEELLRREGKEQLAADILAEASRHFVKQAPAGKADAHAKDKAGKGKGGSSPVRGVLFSSFIVQ